MANSETGAAGAGAGAVGVGIVHCAVAGRGRFACPGIYRRRELLDRLESRLNAYSWVTVARGNVRTGTVLIEYAPERTTELVGLALQAELARLQQSAKAGEALVDEVRPPEEFPDRTRASSGDHQLPAAQREAAHRPPTTLRKSGGDWYRRSGEEICRTLATHGREGLSATAASQRLADRGLNVLPQPPRRSDSELFVSQLWNGPVALLAGAALLSVATGGLVDAAAIGAVVLMNAAIGFVTERKSERIIEGLARPESGDAWITRERAVQQIPAAELVEGDLVHLTAGDRIPADVRLLESTQLTVNESLLTGESTPVAKTASAIHSERALADRTNMVYRDSEVVSGTGSGIVVATGRATEVGQVHDLIGSAAPPDTPMQRQLDRIGSQLVWLSAGICVGIFAIGWLRGYGLVGMLNRAVSLAVAALPEGLPTVATTTLALGVREMRDHRALVRSLNAVETLGACSVVCLDKTGTLTENRLRAVEIRLPDHTIELESATLDLPLDLEAVGYLGRTLALCVENGHVQSHPHPDSGFSPTETALLELAGAAVGDHGALRRRHPLVDIEQRADHRPYLITHHQYHDRVLTSAKGSPESLLELCDAVLTDSGPVPLDDARRARILEQNRHMADRALRVLGAAFRLDDRKSRSDAGLTWLGLVGLADPLRPSARRLIEQLHSAGIQTVMLTGDQAPTASAIARSLKLSDGDPLRVVDAQDLAEATDLDSVHAFSRVAPGQKSEIVSAFQRAGKVVAMTGDGVNDGPALKAADIGIALGANGTETARLAADVVLEDDNLATLVFSVSQGRTIYSNIRKSIHYLLATNLSEIEVMLASVVFNLGQPLSPMQLLWINLVTDIFPGLALALEPPEPDVLNHRPRDPRTPIIGNRDFRRLAVESSAISAGALGSYVYGLARHGAGPQASGQCFLTLVLAQLAHTWSCRSDQRVIGSGQRRNHYIEAAVGGSLALQAIAALVPPMRRLLGIPRLGPMDMLMIVAGALGPLLISELTKTRALPAPPAKEAAVAEQPPA